MPPKGQSGAVARTAASATSKKRKLSTQTKFYAVRAGHKLGVFLNWEECKDSITGFKGAQFKKFDIQADAEAFAAGHEPPPSVASTAASKYYGVAKGRVPGVYTEWTAAQEQIKGWKQPKYKEFATRGEAEAFVRSGGKGNTPDVSKDTEESNGAESQSEDFEDDNSEEGRPKKSRKSSPNQNAGGAVVNGKDSKGGKERSQKHSSGTSTLTASIRSKPSGQTVPLIVHTDGSSRGNGKIGAVAGVGVYFGEGDPRNLGEPLKGLPQTNQRAELTAILRALEIAPSTQDVHIYTDSRYSIDCSEKWHKNWEKNGWKTSLGGDVVNKDVIQGILSKKREREELGSATKFTWVKGHNNDPGNVAADQLANQGADKKARNRNGFDVDSLLYDEIAE